MVFPERFSNLPEYAFPRLRALLDVHAPGGEVLHMTIGEPRHAYPAFLKDVIAANTDGFGKYPPNEGTPELLDAISNWLRHRYGVDVPAAQIIVFRQAREPLRGLEQGVIPTLRHAVTASALTARKLGVPFDLQGRFGARRDGRGEHDAC